MDNYEAAQSITSKMKLNMTIIQVTSSDGRSGVTARISRNTPYPRDVELKRSNTTSTNSPISSRIRQTRDLHGRPAHAPGQIRCEGEGKLSWMRRTG